MMQPVGVVIRRTGEQALAHECLGCGVQRRNRIAADDNSVSVMRLPVLQVRETESPVARSAS